jgi:hypothetical protein
MKTQLIAALALAAIVSAPSFASDNVTPLTRAQVQAELAQARAAGQLDFAGSQYPVFLPSNAQSSAVPSKTRAEVQAELAKARAAGELDFAGSQYPVFTVSNAAGKSRAEVRAELADARNSGLINFANYPLETNTGN